MKERNTGLHSPDQKSAENSAEQSLEKGKYQDEVPGNAAVNNPNRNTSKGEDHFNTEERSHFRRDTFNNDVVSISPETISREINREVILELAGWRSPMAISIYIPTHRAGMEVNEQQDASLFKTMLQEVRKFLLALGWNHPSVEQLLETGMELLRNEKFWYEQQHGLAVFIAENYFSYHKMSYQPKQQIYYNDRFFLVPLMEVLNRNESFFLLTFSKKQSELYKVDHYGLEKVQVEDMPSGMDSVLRYDKSGSEQLFRSGGSGGQGASYHGMSSGVPDEKTQLAIYLEELDERVMKSVLSTSQLPLLLAAVDYLIPIYKKVSHYKYIADASLTGNFDAVGETELYQKARDIMQPYFVSFVEKELEEFNNNIATGITSSIPADIIPACFYGQTKVLFIQANAHLWGKFNDTANQLFLHDTMEEGDYCLLNEAAVRTLANGGMVYVLDKERMPAESQMAAVMRY